jgi:hypothetical protein
LAVSEHYEVFTQNEDIIVEKEYEKNGLANEKI